MDASRPQLDETNDLEGSISRHLRARQAINDPLRESRWAAWRAENAEAIESWNAYIAEYGLPLARFRQF